MLDLKSLIVHNSPKSPIAESYRVLRTNIQFASVDKPTKVMLVTSSCPEEGKTTTIVNLAITFAQSGSKVLLLDADLRKPNVHRSFGLVNNIGMTTVLAQHIDYNTCIASAPIENLYILTSGPIPPNPSELLSSNAMKSLIGKLREDFDIILLDSPPVGVVTDAAILSTIVDGTILVVSSGKIEIEAVQRAKELLQKVNANILGAVLNNIKRNGRNNYYYNYYYANDCEGEKVNKKRKKKKHKKSKQELVGY